MLLFFRIILAGLLIFLIICTVIEVSTEPPANPMKKPLNFGRLSVLGNFSLRKNARSILSLDREEGTLLPIQGLRFFFMILVIYAHECFHLAVGVNVNNLDIVDVKYRTRNIECICYPLIHILFND